MFKKTSTIQSPALSAGFLVLTMLFCAPLHAVQVRVLLSDNAESQWDVSSARGVILRNAKTQRTYPESSTCHKFILETKDGILRVNGKKMAATEAWIQPIDGNLMFNGREYDGQFLVVKEKNKWFLINGLDLEEYLYSVVYFESWPGWELEVKMAQAVACRSYVLNWLLQQRDALYHIKSTNHHQMYQGVHQDKMVRQAIDETRGIFVAYNDYPILAMFDCCCGGVIPANIVGQINFTKAPYLARKYACTHCKDSKLFSWSMSCSVDEFTSAIQDIKSSVVHPVRDVKISQRDKAGLVQKVTVSTKRDDVHLHGREVYRIFKDVKSHCFSVLKKGKTITMTGTGYGHQLGMCQWGAREMVRSGASHREVLAFYYPDTTLMKLATKEEKQKYTITA